MVANYNDVLRKQISDCLKDEYEFEAIDYFYNLDYNEQVRILRLILADYYKLSYYFLKEIPELFNFKTNDIIDECINNNVNAVLDLMKATSCFHNLDYISKCLIMEEMEYKLQDANIFSIYKFHFLDKLTYKIVDDMNYYKKYYIDYLEKHKNNPERIINVTEFISYRMLDIKYTDSNKYQKYILECIKVYYKWKVFIKDHDGNHLLNKNDLIYLDIINNNTIEEIFIRLEDNLDFLVTVVGEYLYYKTQKIEIKEEFIDKYFDDSPHKKIKEKLK